MDERFDRQVSAQGIERSAVESIYSLAGVTVPGSRMDHVEVINLLTRLWIEAGQRVEIPGLVAEYLRRDLINLILGNSDNHGRITAIYGLPQTTFNHQAIALGKLAQRLTAWGLQ